MASANHVDSLFSDADEDSFDTPVPMSKSVGTEEFEDEMESSIVKEVAELDLEEEDFDLITIEKVPMHVLANRMERVLTEILYRGETAAMALFDVATKIVFQSTMLESEENSVIEMIIRGLTKIILDERERDERAERGAHILMVLVAKLAIKNKSLKCEELLLRLVFLIDQLSMHTNSLIRTRICGLIVLIVKEANRYEELMHEHGNLTHLLTDDEPQEPEVIITNGVKHRWMKKLAKSLLDKAPLVRREAVIALSLWDHDTVYKSRKGDELSINELLWRSVHDVDEAVRITAARHLHIVGETDNDKCMNYMETSKDTKVRQAIVMRMSSDVHMLSFSEQQRFRLVNILANSDSARVQEAFSQLLVNAWMTVAEEETDRISTFPTPNPKDNVPPGFPSIILEFLNPLVDQKAAYGFLKFATIRFIRGSDRSRRTNSADLEKFLEDLLQLTTSESKCVGLMRRSSFRLLEGASDDVDCLKRTFTRILITRCFLDVVFQLSAGHLNSVTLRTRALMFFVPDVTILSTQLEEFCEKFFRLSDEPVLGWTELLFVNIFHLINVSLKHGNNDFDKEVNKKSLEKLLKNPDLQFSNEVVVTMVTMVLDLCKNAAEVETTCEWISNTATNLLLFNDNEGYPDTANLEEAMEKDIVLDRMYLRSAKMLLATCQHRDVREPSQAMTELFKAMIPALLGNQNEEIQVTGLELIGFAASIDFENSGPYLKLTQLLILRDDKYLTATGLNTLVRVIKSHGFSETALSIFEDGTDHEDLLAKLFEKAIVSLSGMALAQAVRDCLSLLSHVHCAWPRLLSAILLIVFQKKNEGFQLPKLFMLYCKTSVRSKWSKVHLLQSFTRAISVASRFSESDASWNIGEMTSMICELLSSVQTVGEDENLDMLQMGGGEEPVHIEVELASRMISRAESHPSAWFVRHVFTSMATSLSLQCVPIDQLRKLHNTVLDSYHKIRFNSGKTTQIAVKRFVTYCEKMITLHDRRHGLNLKADLRKVKEEDEDQDSSCVIESSSSSSITKRKGKQPGARKSSSNKWDSDGIEDDGCTDEDFEYCPQSTRTRKRPNASSEVSHSPQKRPRSRMEDLEMNFDDSFEL